MNNVVGSKTLNPVQKITVNSGNEEGKRISLVVGNSETVESPSASNHTYIVDEEGELSNETALPRQAIVAKVKEPESMQSGETQLSTALSSSSAKSTNESSFRERRDTMRKYKVQEDFREAAFGHIHQV